jgi:uncharacterized membrane protein YjgN (DUF898 family)
MKNNLISTLAELQNISYAQKADTEKKKLKSTFQNLSFLKIKTYDIIIQETTLGTKILPIRKNTYEKNLTKYY